MIKASEMNSKKDGTVDAPSKVKSPAILELAVGASLLTAWLLVLSYLGRMHPEVQIDTESYVSFPVEVSAAALKHTRTFGYPVLLSLYRIFQESNSDPWAYLPFIQFGLWFLAVGVWYWTLRERYSLLMALGGSLPLLGSQFVWTYGRHVTPDLVASSSAIIACSFWIRCYLGHFKVITVGLSAVFCFLAYQCKPAYLFLIPFFSLGGCFAAFWFRRSVQNSEGSVSNGESIWRLIGASQAIAFFPFISWSMVRWICVGHFGLVSFGGYNAIGIAGQLLQWQDISKLDVTTQELAKSFLEKRDSHPTWRSPDDYAVFERQFNATVWEIAVPAALEQSSGETSIANAKLSRLSKSIATLRPTDYLYWMAQGAKKSVGEVLKSLTQNKVLLLMAIAVWVWHCTAWVKQGRVIAVGADSLSGDESGPQPFESSTSKGRVRANELERHKAEAVQVVGWMAIGFAVCKIGLVLLVEPPIERYVGPAVLFLEGFLGLALTSAISNYRIRGAAKWEGNGPDGT